MPERSERQIIQTSAWMANKIAERMDQEPTPLKHYRGSRGYGFQTVDAEHPEDRREIGLYHEKNIVKISTPDVSIEVRNAMFTPAKDGIRVDTESGNTRVLFLRDGHVALEVSPIPSLALPESPISGEKPSDEEIPDSLPMTGPEAPGDVETASVHPSETPQTGEQKERQPRVKFTGRLGADPHYEQSQRSGLVTRFPVAENTEDQQTVWHRVYSTGKSAERIQRTNLSKGDKVNVDGYQQQRPRRMQDGSTQPQEVVFAINVKKLGTSAPADSTPSEE